jgi:hypothetical protein
VAGRLHFPLLFLMLSFCQSYAAGYDSYGGWLELKGKRTGFFHTEQIQGRWWLISPAGNALFSKGVDHVGENSNCGVVKIDGVPWETLTTRMKEVNAELEAPHAKAQMC